MATKKSTKKVVAAVAPKPVEIKKRPSLCGDVVLGRAIERLKAVDQKLVIVKKEWIGVKTALSEAKQLVKTLESYQKKNTKNIAAIKAFDTAAAKAAKSSKTVVAKKAAAKKK